MPKVLTYTDTDATLRYSVYQFIVTRGHVPKIRELAAALSRFEKAVRSGLQHLARRAHSGASAEHLGNSSRRSLLAVPTAFQVHSGKHTWWASCIWDALAIPATLRHDGRITTACACCDSWRAGAAPGKFRAALP
jgi:hypothetical protein